MKQRYCKRLPKDENSVQFLVSQGIPRELAEAFSARGIFENNFADFFGEHECFHSPFEMANMREAAETISYVLESGGSVLICGDYDADGLTASSILSLFFSDNGVPNDVLIPTRDMGYGLHAETVLEAFSQKFYDLIITVDCGISNKVEVEKIQEELDAEIIVTDHHELPSELPPCLCVNPKLGYPFPDLAGAGVAWKLVEALAGREVAARYSALAMIGTIGDLMPLTDENRSLVKLGLSNFEHKSLKKLAELSKCSQQLTASDVAMKLAPKINAAGRMGDPTVALKVLLSRDKVSPFVEQLLQMNEQRKFAMDELTSQADKMCDEEQIRKDGLVFLYSDGWQHGILGIAAARYKEKYGLPAAVLTLDNEKGVYVGSARGVEGGDLFETFSQCGNLLTQFGGHKAAVGFSVSPQNLLPLKAQLSQVLAQSGVHAEKQLYYDIELANGCNLADMFEFVQRFEPCLPQDKLVFHVQDTVECASTFGKDKSHLSVMLHGGLEIKCFNRGNYATIIRNGADIEGLISLCYDDYSKHICGMAEDIRLKNSVCFDEFYKLNLIKNLNAGQTQPICAEEVSALLAENSVLAIFDDYATYLAESARFDFSDFYEDIFFDTGFSEKTVAVSPLADYDFAKYKHIIYFCKQGYLRPLPQSAVYCLVQPANSFLYGTRLNRDVCTAVYRQLKRKSAFDSIRGVYDKYLLGTMDYDQYLAAIRVFEELKFVEIPDNYTVNFLPSPKVELTDSAIYRLMSN